MSTTVVLADDHAIMRKAIAHLLHGDPDIQILAQASTFAETLDLVFKLHPHVVVLAWIIHDFTGEKRKDALKGVMNTGFFANPAFSFGASQR